MQLMIRFININKSIELLLSVYVHNVIQSLKYIYTHWLKPMPVATEDTFNNKKNKKDEKIISKLIIRPSDTRKYF